MKTILMLLALAWATPALADPATAAGDRLLQRFADALRHKDAATVALLVRPEAEVHILLLDTTPPKRFTITGARYVQQLRALWRFTRNDRHEFGPVEWQQQAGGRLAARLLHRESRELQGADSGQEDRLELELEPRGNDLVISRINAGTRMW